MNHPIYVGMSILDISKIHMYEFWCNYFKPKYQGNAELCYMDTDSVAIHIKTEDFYEDIEKWFDTSNYGKYDNRLLLIWWNEKNGLFKDELGERLWKNLLDLEEKHGHVQWMMILNIKKGKGTKTSVKKEKFKNYKDCQSNDKTILKSEQRFKSVCHSVYTEKANNTALSSNDDKRLQTFDKSTTYPYGTNAFKVCKSEMLSKI